MTGHQFPESESMRPLPGSFNLEINHKLSRIIFFNLVVATKLIIRIKCLFFSIYRDMKETTEVAFLHEALRVACSFENRWYYIYPFTKILARRGSSIGCTSPGMRMVAGSILRYGMVLRSEGSLKLEMLNLARTSKYVDNTSVLSTNKTEEDS